jgi:type II secretory pathway pseudopilin PulG
MKKKVKQICGTAGQSLIEIIIVTMVVGTILTAIAASVSMSSKNINETKKKDNATHLAQEVLEVFHRERYVLGWSSFQSALQDGTYCLDTLPSDSAEFVALVAGECTAAETMAGTDLIREAILVIAADEVQVTSMVTWNDGDQEKNVTVEQSFQEIN